MHWFALFIAVVLTFLYSAPKIPLPFFRFLKQVAVGKTIFLAMVWVYVTAVLPVYLAGIEHFDDQRKWFAASRFFLVYAICILFDFRDRFDDKQEGIRTIVNYFDEPAVNRLFQFSVVAFIFFTLGLYFSGATLLQVIILLVPGILLMALYPKAKQSRSDYLYYVVLDGLMALSAMIMAIGTI